MPLDRDTTHRPDEPTPGDRRAIRDGQRATSLVLLACLLSMLPHPWSAAAVLAGLVALGLALRAVAHEVRVSRWGWAAWHLVAVAFAGYLIGAGSLAVAYPRQLDAWATCTTGAATRVAQAQCDAELVSTTPSWVRGVIGAG